MKPALKWGIGLFLTLSAASQARSVDFQVVQHSIPAAVAGLSPVGALPASTNLTLAIGLPLRDPNGLAGVLRRLYDPSSPDYRHFLSAEEFASRYGPTEQDYQALIRYARAHGFTVAGTHPNRMLLDVTAPVSVIEKAFHVRMLEFQHPNEKRVFYSADTEPSLDLAVPVLGISGLDNFAPPRPRHIANLITNLSSAAANAGSGPAGTYAAYDFRAAYVPGWPLTGSGQVVGLLQFDGYTSNDIAYYESRFGLPSVTLSNVLLNGVTGRPSGGGGEVEVSLDIEMSISMAPGLSKVIVYEGANWHDILNRMATDNLAKQLSCSWYSPGGGPDAVADQIWRQMAAQGQSFYNASGDADAYTGPIDFPGDTPYITQVGGTTLTTTGPAGAYVSETVWNWGGGTGSGGGISTSYAIPSWQTNIDMTANLGSTALRNTPDVALTADNVYVRADNQDYNVGGTSCAAPLWAGYTALINQLALQHGEPLVGFINPAAYGLGQRGDYKQNFHDITTGNNQRAGSGSRFPAVAGYDLCTGWGTPTGSNLLYSLGVPEPLRIAPESGMIFTGPAGGPFNATVQTFTLTNHAGPALDWSLACTSTWLNATPAGGTLMTGGPPATVSVALTATASNLPPGSYPATIWFTNLSSHFVQNRPATLAIVTPPVITSQPVSQAVFEGASASFNVGTASNALMYYQWQFDNGSYATNLSDGGAISGSTTSMLTVSNVSAANQGAYFVTVSNAAGSATSDYAFLTLVPWRPVITQQPASQSVLPGAPARFTVAAVGTHPFSYRWRRDGLNLSDGPNISGAGTSSLTLSNVTSAVAGTYSVVVSNTLGTAASTGAALGVISVTAPGVTLNALASFVGGNSGENPYSPLVLAKDGNYYGTTVLGGPNGAGTIFRFNTNGVITTIHNFTGGNDGAIPYAGLLLAKDGYLYGTTSQSGANGDGTVYRVTTNGLFTTLAAFNGVNGFLSVGGLIQGADGNLYGTTVYGGPMQYGNVFRVAPTLNASISNLYLFNYTDGAYPSCVLAQDAEGNLYGTTENGGTNGGWGTVFKITSWGAFSTLVHFAGTNGGVPIPGLVQDSDGNFYGTTYEGGTNYTGSVFRMSPDGALTNLYSFTGNEDGGYPFGGLLLGEDGNLYGTTSSGGTYSDGTVFRIDRDGALTTLAQFDGYQGAYPAAALVQGPDSKLYGTTESGGLYDWGAIYQIGFDGPLEMTSQPASQWVYLGGTATFSVATYGGLPVTYQWEKAGTNLVDGGGVSGSNGRILTVTNAQVTDAGVYSVVVANVFGSVTSAPAFLQILVSPPYITQQPASRTNLAGSTAAFQVEAVGDMPLFYQWQRDGTNLVDGGRISGAASRTLVLSGVTAADMGMYSVVVSDDFYWAQSEGATLTVIPITAPDYTLTTLRTFTGGSDGGILNGLVSARDGYLYGTAQSGGNNGYGNLFRMSTNGAVNTVLTFNQSNGAYPYAGVVQGSDFFLYGTTLQGGASYAGSIYRIATNGSSFSNLYGFTGGSDGNYPTAGLVQGRDGALYGTTHEGGNDSDGTVFKITTNGLFTTLYQFTGAGDGMGPWAGLVQGRDGNFYGTTAYGGASGGRGTVFRITPAGVRTTLHTFHGSLDGANPEAGLVQGADGWLYGATSAGGSHDEGTVFKMTTNGALTTLHQFSGSDGSSPVAALIQQPDGTFYGTTEAGGLGGYGTVFKITTNGALSTLVWFTWTNGAYPQAPLVLGADGNYYGTTAYGGNGGYGTTFRLVAPMPPRITRQPTNQTSYTGTDASFVVGAIGTTPLSYQWQKNGTNLADAGTVNGSSTSILTLRTVSDADDGIYSVVVTNLYGSVTSTGAVLTALGAAPMITLQPANQSQFSGGTATFDVAAVGSLPMSFQWQHGGTNLADSANVSGSSTASLRISNLAASDAGGYSAIVSNAIGWTNSVTATLTVQLLTAPGTTLSTLKSFAGNDYEGANPNGLTLGRDGRLYGTTSKGGAGSYGTVFTVTTNGDFSTLYSFSGGNDGRYPSGTLIQAADGDFYGSTFGGGAYGSGTAFRISTNGAFATVSALTGGADGAYPFGRLAQTADGLLYGTALAGGAHGNGSVFKLTTGGALNAIYSFTGGVDDGSPYAGLVLAGDGNFYGTASGAIGNGGVFRVDTNGALASIYHFAGGVDGAYPLSGLIQLADGKLYGTTSAGGTNNNGNAFAISTNGTLTVLHLFTGGTDGGSPDYAGLMQAGDGQLYGTTAYGGTYGLGTVYRLTTGGDLTTLVWFHGDNGAQPEAELAQGPDGNLYGTTWVGGAYGQGTIFKLTVPPVLTPPAFQSISVSNGIVTLTWTAVPGQSYQAEWCADLHAGVWSALGGTMPGAVGGTLTVTDLMGTNVQRFYRVMVVSPP
jgi:uncharacterized repeat protein (TIGR03803 family)